MDQARKLREDAAACDFVAQFLADHERGVERALGEYQAAFPEFAERIAAEHAALLSRTALASEPPPDVGRNVGPYRLLERLGHGGQGIVFRAEHRELKRVVALKMLHRGVLGLGAAKLARLRREAMAVARLDHPAICAVYEVELEGPEPYLAMRHVPGHSLAVAIEAARQRRDAASLPPRSRAEIEAWLSFFERAALALHAAHLVGIVHRDVKPHNLMCTPTGDPVLLDFGLARDATSTSAALTGTHELFGTLAYMAPELLAAGATPNAQHDVYALGATLYETLTLQQPFAAATPEALWRRIDSGNVTAPRELNPNVPRDVDVVVATALERDPARRYPTAAAFADDLRRLRLRESILARPPSGFVRAARWARRHPVFSVAFGLLLVGFAVVMLMYGQVVQSNRQLAALQRAQAALSRSELQPGEALRDAVAAANDSADPQITDILVQVLDRCDLERIHVEPSRLMTRHLASSRDGAWVASPMMDGDVLLVHVADSSAEPIVVPAATGFATATFGGTSERLLTAGGDGILRAWSLPTLQCVREWSASTDPAASSPTTVLVTSADGRLVARGDANGNIDVVDVDQLVPARRWAAHTGNVTVLAFDPAGERLLSLSRDFHGSWSADYSIALHDVRAGAVVHRFGPFPGTHAPYHATWSPDGAWIAIGCDDGAVRVFDAATGAPIERLSVHLRGPAATVAFDPLRRRMLTGSLDGLVVFDIDTGRELHRIVDALDRSVQVVRLRRDGSEVAALSNDATTRVYDAETLRFRRSYTYSSRADDVCWAGQETRLVTVANRQLMVWFAGARPWLPDLTGHTDRVQRVSFDRDGERVLSASRDHTARVFSRIGGPAQLVLPHDGAVRSARFSAAGDRVVTACEVGPARMWTLHPVTSIPLGNDPALDAWFCDEDRRVVTIDASGFVRGFDREGHSLFAHRAHPPVPEWDGLERAETRIECASWHPSRPWLATGAGAREVSIFDCVAVREVMRSRLWQAERESLRKVYSVAFTPDGAGLLFGGEDQGAHHLDLVHGAEARYPGAATPGLLAVSGDGERRLVAGKWAAGLTCVDREGKEFTEHLRNVATSLRVDRTGRIALCADKSGRLGVFRISPWERLLSIRASTAPLFDADFSPDGASIVTADGDGRIRIWPTDPRGEAVRSMPRGVSASK